MEIQQLLPSPTTFITTNGTTFALPTLPTPWKQQFDIFGNTIGFLHEDVSACSLCAAGAMWLICVGIDHDHIKCIGRWSSNEMLRYLHVHSAPVIQHYAHAMVTEADFTFIPTRNVENPEVPLHWSNPYSHTYDLEGPIMMWSTWISLELI